MRRAQAIADRSIRPSAGRLAAAARQSTALRYATAVRCGTGPRLLERRELARDLQVPPKIGDNRSARQERCCVVCYYSVGWAAAAWRDYALAVRRRGADGTTSTHCGSGKRRYARASGHARACARIRAWTRASADACVRVYCARAHPSAVKMRWTSLLPSRAIRNCSASLQRKPPATAAADRNRVYYRDSCRAAFIVPLYMYTYACAR